MFDDSCEKNFNDKEFSKIGTTGLYKRFSVTNAEHNLFQQRKWSRTIDLNTTRNVLIISPSDVQQIGSLGRQLSQQHTILRETNQLATKQPFGHLLTDLER